MEGRCIFYIGICISEALQYRGAALAAGPKENEASQEERQRKKLNETDRTEGADLMELCSTGLWMVGASLCVWTSPSDRPGHDWKQWDTDTSSQTERRNLTEENVLFSDNSHHISCGPEKKQSVRTKKEDKKERKEE
ncbi:hypothetical protein SRHO_G00253380 [Serrasalmus rhombeus]